MTEVESLAEYVCTAGFQDFSADALKHLKVCILDTIGVAIAALDAKPIQLIHNQVEEFGGNPLCTLIGGNAEYLPGPRASSPDRAAFYNGALVRYLDFMDSYLAPGETFHPSDNLGAVLAAAEYRGATGQEFLTALAVAYEVQARLSEAAPVRAKGFDHVTQGAYACAAGIAKALDLDAEKTAHAIAISGTTNNALRVTRTGTLSHWKGLAYPHVAYSATHSAFLAMRGITGPLEVFEGNKGFKQSIAGPYSLAWKNGGFEKIRRTLLKKYNAEIHSQSAIEGLLELQEKEGFEASEIDRIDLEVFQVAYSIIGGGEEGSKFFVRTKEEADHSLPYLVAVALLDREVYPEQFEQDRIESHDVQALLTRVHVRPAPDLTARFPAEMPIRATVHLKNGTAFSVHKSDYEGFYTRPMTWDIALSKYERLTRKWMDPESQTTLAQAIDFLPEIEVRELTRLLGNLGSSSADQQKQAS